MEKRIKHLLRESLLLSENVKQAEKILKQNNIPLDNPEYLELRKEVEANKAIGFLGPLVNMCVKHGTIYASRGKDYLNLLIQNKDFLKLLPKPVHEYTNGPDFITDIYYMKIRRNFKRLSNKLTNPDLKGLFANPPQHTLESISEDHLEDLNYFVNTMDSSDQKEVLVKSDKFRDWVELLDIISVVVEEHRDGFGFEKTLKEVKALSNFDVVVRLADQEKGIILLHVLTYEGSKALGSKSWCIVGNEKQWEEYTKHGFQFFLFNFKSEKPDNKMLAFTLDADNNVSHSFDRYDNVFNDLPQHLSELGVKDAIFKINSRLRAETKISKTEKLVHRVRRVDDSEVPTQTPIAGFYPVELCGVALFFRTLKDTDFTNTKNMDLVFSKYQKLPIHIFNPVEDTTRVKSINIIPLALSGHKVFTRRMMNHAFELMYGYNDGGFSDVLLPDEELINMMTRVVKTQIKLLPDSRRAIFHFLKEEGVDILSLSQISKDKRGLGMSDMETADQIKRGDDLRPQIQNKLSAIRRGEDADLNVAEINYALENGFEPIIRKHYTSMLPRYADEQLDFEDMQVYRKLGLIPQLSTFIVKKGNMYGVDALNSIEKSIYDLTQRQAS